jgi:hypothetical protein
MYLETTTGTIDVDSWIEYCWLHMHIGEPVHDADIGEPTRWAGLWSQQSSYILNPYAQDGEIWPGNNSQIVGRERQTGEPPAHRLIK